MNVWRLLNARIRQGRRGVLLLQCLASLLTGAVIVGLAERLTLQPVWDLPAGLAGALAAVTVASWAAARANIRIGQWLAGVSRQVRRAILSSYAAAEPQARSEIDRDAMQDALTALPQGLAAFGAGAPGAVTSLFSTIACIVVLLLASPVAGAALLLALKLAGVAVTALLARARVLASADQQGDADLDRVVAETFRELDHTLLAGQMPAARLEQMITARRGPARRALARHATEGAISAAGRICLAAILVSATRLAGAPSDQAAAMMLIAFLVPLDWIAALPHLARLSAAADRLAGFEANMLATIRRAPVSPEPALQPFQTLELREAMFHYPAFPGQPGAIVGPVSLRVGRGQILVLIGGTGAGKTTVLAMLAGHARPEAGALLRDDVVCDARTNRELAGLVTATPLLFAGVAIPNIDRPDIRRLMTALELDHLDALKLGLVPDPAQLSLMLQARIGLLIAVAEDCPLLLFDAWAESQSLAVRTRFYADILPGLRADGRAVVIATSDVRQVEMGDRVVWLGVDGT